MIADDVILVGDKIELVIEKGRPYKTMIEDMTGNGLYLVGIPSYGGVPMLLHAGDSVLMAFFRESGRYVTRMKVAGLEKRGEIRYAWLTQESKPRHLQRRDAYRLPENLKVIICEYTEKMEEKLPILQSVSGTDVLETVSSRDISVSGISLVVKREYKIGEKSLLKLYFRGQQDGSQLFIVCAEVVRLIPEHKKGLYCVGMRFFGQTGNMNENLARYVLNRQQIQIKKRKLMESD